MHPVDFKYLQIDRDSIDDEYVTLRSTAGPYGKSDVHGDEDDEDTFWKTSWPVTALWTLLSLLVTVTCSGGFTETEWFVRENGTDFEDGSSKLLSYDRYCLTNALGMLSACKREFHDQHLLSCMRFGTENPFPSAGWQIAVLFYGIGCVLQGCGLLILLMCLSSGRLTYRKLASNIVSNIHVIAGLLQTLGLFIFPVILATSVGRQHCGGEATAYTLDNCRVGWAYVACTGGTLLTFYCPFLAYFSIYKVYRDPATEGYWIF